jgi:segregation and condensation protein B
MNLEQHWDLDVEPVATGTEEVGQQENNEPDSEHQASVHNPPFQLARIIEAIFFAADEAVLPEKICQIIRDLTAEQCLETIQQLNREYRQQGRPYRIDRETVGYRLRLRNRFKGVLEKLYGGLKEARFNPAAVETLAIVAYRQPITKATIDAIRGQESEGSLRQLIRRGLVIDQGKDDQNQLRFAVTPRFLKFFQLHRVDELPRADDLERI